MNGDIGGSFLGLGFSHSGGQEQTTPASPIDAADSLMKHYLQQCLEFHDEQQQQHGQEEDVPQFITAQHPPRPETLPKSQLPPTAASVTRQTTTINQASLESSSVSNHDPLSHPSAQEAIAKAQAIIQKFQQQHHHFESSASSSDFRYRRQIQLKKEQERLHKATLKNFEYVAKREEERLQRQLLQLQETQHLEARLQQQQQAALLQSKRQQQQVQSKAGIGTSRRHAVEKNKVRQGHVARHNDDLTIAIYLSGLPLDNAREDFIRQLFESYGTIRRVHLYRNKQTGELKDDALVVYNVKRADEKQQVLDAACSQMNGAELPCGSILHVEPADPMYKQQQSSAKHDAKEATGYYGPASTLTAKQEMAPVVVETRNTSEKDNSPDAGEDDDLDDFFDSL